jgi:nitroreductase
MNDKNQQILETIQNRYACKKFDRDKIISEKDFNTILEAGRLSPSSFGFEPWKFLVIQDEEVRKKLLPNAWGAQNSLNGASHFVILLARRSKEVVSDSDYIWNTMTDVQRLPENIALQKKEHFGNFQKDDFKLLENERAAYDWASKQTYIALANMLTTAAFLGIDSCPIEGFNIEAVEKLLEDENILDTERFGVSLMAGFGYRAQEPSVKTRRSQNEVVQWV